MWVWGGGGVNRCCGCCYPVKELCVCVCVCVCVNSFYGCCQPVNGLCVCLGGRGVGWTDPVAIVGQWRVCVCVCVNSCCCNHYPANGLCTCVYCSPFPIHAQPPAESRGRWVLPFPPLEWGPFPQVTHHGCLTGCLLTAHQPPSPGNCCSADTRILRLRTRNAQARPLHHGQWGAPPTAAASVVWAVCAGAGAAGSFTCHLSVATGRSLQQVPAHPENVCCSARWAKIGLFMVHAKFTHGNLCFVCVLRNIKL